MPKKFKVEKIEIYKIEVNANEYDERLEIIARILYKYFCQFKKVNPADRLNNSSLSTKTERAA
ncbi:MAG: hypothetical protein SGJ18_08290 [Pseudomonadota bacterium]|nr:hypothetical protein [Pseudomonadota bacterium]